MIPVFLIILVCLLCFILLRKVSPLIARNICIKKVSDRIYYILFWNSTFRYIIEGYLAITLESLTFISKGLDWSTELNIKQDLFAIISMSFCGFVPLAMTLYFIRNFTQFINNKFLRRFSSVIGDFNYRYKWSPMFISIFCYRRLIMSLLIVFLPSYPYAQV